jgi:hypothetical protein
MNEHVTAKNTEFGVRALQRRFAGCSRSIVATVFLEPRSDL